MDALDTRYADAESEPPVPPEKSVRIELAPRFAYPFPPGATALRGTLRRAASVSRGRSPERPCVCNGRTARPGSTRRPAVTTDERGDFAAPLRFAPTDEPRRRHWRLRGPPARGARRGQRTQRRIRSAGRQGLAGPAALHLGRPQSVIGEEGRNDGESSRTRSSKRKSRATTRNRPRHLSQRPRRRRRVANRWTRDLSRLH